MADRRFSEYLQPESETEGTYADVSRETSPTPLRERPFSGPDPDMMPDVTVVRPFETVEGRRVLVDVVDRSQVEAGIKQLTYADIQGEFLLTQQDTAAFLAVSASTLKAWREAEVNLPYYIAPSRGKFNNRRIFYRVSDLIRYREFVMSRVSPRNGMRMPPPGTMGVPLDSGVFPSTQE